MGSKQLKKEPTIIAVGIVHIFTPPTTQTPPRKPNYVSATRTNSVILNRLSWLLGIIQVERPLASTSLPRIIREDFCSPIELLPTPLIVPCSLCRINSFDMSSLRLTAHVVTRFIAAIPSISLWMLLLHLFFEYAKLSILLVKLTPKIAIVIWFKFSYKILSHRCC